MSLATRIKRLESERRILPISQADPLADGAKTSFKEFVKIFWPTVSPSPLRGGWYLDAICDHLQNLKDIKRLIINMPPRHGKSTLVSVLFPAWYWIANPSTKYICSTYSLRELSTRDSIACRSVIESPQYQRNWWNCFTLSNDQNTKTRFSNDRLGFRLAASVESAVLGEGGDILIGDDLNNVAKIHSDAERLNVINFWTSVVSTRLNPGGLDCKVVVQQRCHEEDITGYIIANDKAGDWTRLILPWEFEPDRRSVTSLWEDPRTTAGEPLSDLYSSPQIEEKKGGNGLGPTGFATQFQQRPAPAGGNVFKESWFRRYQDDGTHYILEGVRIKKDTCSTFITSDIAVSLKTSADWTVAQVWRVTPHNHLLLVHQYRERVESPDALKAFQNLVNEYNPDCVYMEEAGQQGGIIQFFRRLGLPIRSVKPGTLDKKTRAQRAIVKAECRQIWLPEEAEWLPGWLSEVTQFPNAAHDDQVDALAIAGIVAGKYPCHELPTVVHEDKEKRLREAEARLLSR